MSQGFHRIHPKHKEKVYHNSLTKLFEKGMYAIALIAPVMTIPQLYDVWMHHKAAGVSLATWGAYACVSGLWLFYGIIHKEKPMILTQFLLLILDGAIVIGVLFSH